MKNKTNIAKNFLAKDVFPKWRKVVAASTRTLTIFTPYFDNSLVALLKSSDLPCEHVKIITDFDPETLLRLVQQLKASKSLIQAGFKLFHLPGLHAKILISDNSHVVLGSQNYTRRGRRNKEASVLSPVDLSGSKFIAVVGEWMASATEIQLGLVEQLLQELEPLRKPAVELLQKVSDAVARAHKSADSSIFTGAAPPSTSTILQTLDHLKASQQVRFRSVYLLASLKKIFDSRTYDSYWALTPDERFGNFQDWFVRNEANRLIPLKLERLKFCLLMRKEDFRLVWGRVAKGRITYVRQSVSFSALETLGDFKCKLSVAFPRDAPEKCNVIFKLIANELVGSSFSSNHGECEVRALFDGDTTHVIEAKFSDKNVGWLHQNMFENFKVLCTAMFTNTQQSSAFFFKALKGGFKFEKLGIRKKNISEFLGQSSQSTFRIYAMQTGQLRWLLIE